MNIDKNIISIGVDEVGRGCLMGPVYTSATIILPENIKNITKDKNYQMIKDSKKISEPKRKELYNWLTTNKNIFFGIGISNIEEIDELNIRNATFLAMNRAIADALNKLPSTRITNSTNKDKILCYIDGNGFKVFDEFKELFDNYNIEFKTIIKGDDTMFNIASSSIIAKVSRDKYITELHQQNRNLGSYDWINNKGYGTSGHINAIFKYGITIHHRLSFLDKIFKNRLETASNNN